MVKLLILSFQKWGLAQIFDPDAGPQFAGLDNYQRIFSDSFFWTVLLRTVLVATAMVVLSMLAGLGVALVMGRVPGWCRWLMTFSLVLAWAVPHPVSTEMFAWLTDYNYGVVNWLFGIPRHNWYIDNVQGLGVATAVVVWGAEDKTDTVSEGRTTARALRAPFVLIPHAAHLSMLTNPGRVAQAIAHIASP